MLVKLRRWYLYGQNFALFVGVKMSQMGHYELKCEENFISGALKMSSVRQVKNTA